MRMQESFCSVLGALAVLLLTMCWAARVHSQDFFYKGETIRIVVGASAGGGFDTYSRVVGRHLGKHVPGNPSVIVQNMPGAGTLIAAKHVYDVAKPDGLTIGNFIGDLVLGQLLGREGITFKAKEFQWLGVPGKDHIACVLTTASGITDMTKWFASKTPVKLGGIAGTAPGNSALILKEALGLPMHVVTGYPGTAEIRLGAESGELAGGCWQWESIKPTWKGALDRGEVRVLLQATKRPLPDLPNVPSAYDFAKTEEAKRLIEVGVETTSSITRLYAFPPGTPTDRTATMRKAFMNTMRDREFLADAKKSNISIDPSSGEEVEKLVSGIFDLQPELVARLKTTLSSKQ
jgi:tripartite-type tricarboxylate transporter receptor subunit TctC